MEAVNESYWYQFVLVLEVSFATVVQVEVVLGDIDPVLIIGSSAEVNTGAVQIVIALQINHPPVTGVSIGGTPVGGRIPIIALRGGLRGLLTVSARRMAHGNVVAARLGRASQSRMLGRHQWYECSHKQDDHNCGHQSFVAHSMFHGEHSPVLRVTSQAHEQKKRTNMRTVLPCSFERPLDLEHNRRMIVCYNEPGRLVD